MYLAVCVLTAALTLTLPTAAQDAIKPGKRELIKELLTLIRAEKRSEQFTDAILAQMEKELPQSMHQAMMKRMELSASGHEQSPPPPPPPRRVEGQSRRSDQGQPPQMEGVPGGVAVVPPEQQFAERYIRFSKRFRELLQQRINRAEIIEQIYYPLYDKHFTEEELKGLVAFYKTPVGQKAIQVMPQLVQEAMQKASELMLPKLRALVGEIMEEEMNRLKK